MSISEDSLDAVIRRRRQKSHTRFLTAAIIGGIIIASAAAIALILMLTRGRPEDGSGGVLFGPSAGSEGEKWSHAELHKYLQSKGVKCGMEPDGRTEVIFIFAKSKEEQDEIVYFYRGNNRQVAVPQIIECEKMATAELAKDNAGTNPQKSFAWGRFRFRCSDKGKPHMSQIHLALTGKPFE